MTDQCLTRRTRTALALIAVSSSLLACGTDSTAIEAQGRAKESTTVSSDAIDKSMPSLACEGKGVMTPVNAADALATLTNFDGFVPYGFESYQQLRDYSDIAIEGILVDVRLITAKRIENGATLNGSIEADFEVVDVFGGREQPAANPDTPKTTITIALPLTLEEPYATEQLYVVEGLVGEGRFVLFLDRQITGGTGDERFTNLYIPSTLPYSTPSAILFEDDATGRLVRLAPQEVYVGDSTDTHAVRCTKGHAPEGHDVGSAIALLRADVGTVTTPRPTGAYEITEKRRVAAIEAAL